MSHMDALTRSGDSKLSQENKSWDLEDWKAKDADQQGRSTAVEKHKSLQTADPSQEASQPTDKQELSLPPRPMSCRSWADEEDDDDWNFEDWQSKTAALLNKPVTIDDLGPLQQTEQSATEGLTSAQAYFMDKINLKPVQRVQAHNLVDYEDPPAPTAESQSEHVQLAAEYYDPATGVHQFLDEEDFPKLYESVASETTESSNTSTNLSVVWLLPGNNKALYLSPEPSDWPWPSYMTKPSVASWSVHHKGYKTDRPAYPQLSQSPDPCVRMSYTKSYRDWFYQDRQTNNRKSSSLYCSSGLKHSETCEYDEHIGAEMAESPVPEYDRKSTSSDEDLSEVETPVASPVLEQTLPVHLKKHVEFDIDESPEVFDDVDDGEDFYDEEALYTCSADDEEQNDVMDIEDYDPVSSDMEDDEDEMAHTGPDAVSGLRRPDDDHTPYTLQSLPGLSFTLPLRLKSDFVASMASETPSSASANEGENVTREVQGPGGPTAAADNESNYGDESDDDEGNNITTAPVADTDNMTISPELMGVLMRLKNQVLVTEAEVVEELLCEDVPPTPFKQTDDAAFEVAVATPLADDDSEQMELLDDLDLAVITPIPENKHESWWLLDISVQLCIPPTLDDEFVAEEFLDTFDLAVMTPIDDVDCESEDSLAVLDLAMATPLPETEDEDEALVSFMETYNTESPKGGMAVDHKPSTENHPIEVADKVSSNMIQKHATVNPDVDIPKQTANIRNPFTLSMPSAATTATAIRFGMAAAALAIGASALFRRHR